METWAKDWLEDQRKAGEKCLEIKVRGDCHYVYRSTSRYDKKIKKGRKVSVYLGRLDKKYGFILKGEKPKIFPFELSSFFNHKLVLLSAAKRTAGSRIAIRVLQEP
ncbi:MAG: hypothetical protein QM426_00710 [Euryarchaeota archaeon]|nr:hypothetical protein [Euryarchaeota archaeon]